MLQQADDVETTSKKKADYQHVPFHATVKINCKYQLKKTPLHITPRAAVKNDNSG